MSDIKNTNMTELLGELKSVQIERSNLASEGIWPSTPSYKERPTRPGSFLYRFFVKENGQLLSPHGKADLYIPKRSPGHAAEMHQTFSRTKRYFDLGKREDELQREIEKERKYALADARIRHTTLSALRAHKREIEQLIRELEAA